MIAAIYARRSNEQNVSEEAKSVTRQIDNARAFAAKMGWSVLDEYVFVDDGVSGAEFEKRPGFMRMLTLATGPASPFVAVIVSEQKSIGREMSETAYRMKQLARAGVDVYEYVHGRCLTPRNPTEKLLSVVQGYADEDHRVKTAERMREAMRQRAQRGYVTGGRLFGYRNKDVFSGTDASGRPLRSHVDREVNPEEAAVVLRIFEMHADGHGLKSIAKRLTEEGAPSPKYTGGRDGLPPVDGWSPSTVRGVLGREAYRGVIEWNKRRKRDDWGQRNHVRGKSRRPESEWVRTVREDLRIVPEDLWRRVQARRDEVKNLAVRFASGRLSGRPPKNAVPNLLAGLATCGVCGGGLTVGTSAGARVDAFDAGSLPAPGERGNPRTEPYRYYQCSRRRLNGTCSNALRLRVEDVNEAVLQCIEQHALTPEAVEQVIQLSERDEVREQKEKLEQEATEIARKLKRLVDAIEAGGDAASLLNRVRELEQRQAELRAAVAGMRPVPRLAPAVVEGRLGEWRRLLRSSTTQARAVLQKVLRGRITFRPLDDQHGYEFEAPTRFDRLFAGVVAELGPGAVAEFAARAGMGTENITAEVTLDGDYERLLHAAEESMQKGWRPRRDSNPRSQP